MTGQRRAQDEQRYRRTRGFAEPHIEVDKRLESQLVEQHAMPGLGRDVACKRVRERIGPQLRQRRSRRGANEAVEQDWNALPSRRQCRAEDRRKLAAAESRGDRYSDGCWASA